MARIKSKITGDVFEAPAADFAQEPDFDIVDSSTPITTETVPNVAVLIDPSASATPVTADSSVAGDVPNVLTADSTTPVSPSLSGDLGNAAAGADTAPAATDAGSVSQPVAANQPPVTDSVNASPTGGPLPTNDVGVAHQVIAALEADLTAKVNELVQWTDQLKHSATAFFDALHSHVDHQAAE